MQERVAAGPPVQGWGAAVLLEGGHDERLVQECGAAGLHCVTIT